MQRVDDSKNKKYIFVNGVMKKNPDYAGSQQTTLSNAKDALAIVSSTKDIETASDAQKKETGNPIQLSESTISSMEIMQDNDYAKRFKLKKEAEEKLNGSILDDLSNVFAEYEVPLGLINKLLTLSEYQLNFIIDDSGSMSLKSDSAIKGAHPRIKSTYDSNGQRAKSNDDCMSRWEEVEDRIHVMLDMLAYIPADITISFLNRNVTFKLSHEGKTPEQFKDDAHAKIIDAFRKSPAGQTPLYQALSSAFSQSNNNVMHYVFTDGEPSDKTPAQLKHLVANRHNPNKNPTTFISCTSDDQATAWMKEIDEGAQFVAEVDDFYSEQKEVNHDQGIALPFSKGFWLLCQLAAAINPHDLDALDEEYPLAKGTLNNLMGRKLTDKEYSYYFESHPQYHIYKRLTDEFAREDIMAHEIIDADKAREKSKNNAQANPSFWNTIPVGSSSMGSSSSQIAPPPYPGRR